jgi:hypothetical protein
LLSFRGKSLLSNCVQNCESTVGTVPCNWNQRHRLQRSMQKLLCHYLLGKLHIKKKIYSCEQCRK